MHKLIGFLMALAIGSCYPATARAELCPFCPNPQLTFSEQFDKADAVVLSQWVSAAAGEKDKTGSTTYQVVQSVRDPLKLWKKGDHITLSGQRSGRAGDLVLMLGTRATKIEWAPPLDVTEIVFNYILQAPSREAPISDRLNYYLKFLEYPDQTIADDAFSEFAIAPYEEVDKIKSKLPREKLLHWLEDPEVAPGRLGLYGMMLGLCGHAEDAAIMEKLITKPTADNEIRSGIDGVMFGYLLLKGETGLEFLEQHKLHNREAPFGEIIAAKNALVQFWTYAQGRIPPERMRQSMRGLLDRPELADIIIANLSRWKDWSVQDRLMKFYGQGPYDLPSTKRAVVRYLLACKDDIPANNGETLPENVVEARKNLETLRKKDPKTVKDVERRLD